MLRRSEAGRPREWLPSRSIAFRSLRVGPARRPFAGGRGDRSSASLASAAANSSAPVTISVGRASGPSSPTSSAVLMPVEDGNRASADCDRCRDVGRQAVPDHHGLAHGPAREPGRHLEQQRTRLADRHRLHAARGGNGGDERAGSRYEAMFRGVDRIAVHRHEQRSRPHRGRGNDEPRPADFLIEPDDHGVDAGGGGCGVVTVVRPGLGGIDGAHDVQTGVYQPLAPARPPPRPVPGGVVAIAQ